MPLLAQHNDSQRTQSKSLFRNATVCLKLTQQEVQHLDQLATAKGMARSEWMRDVILRELREDSTKDPTLAEILGVRLLLVNVLRPLAAGQRLMPEAFDKLLDEISEAKHASLESWPLLQEGNSDGMTKWGRKESIIWRRTARFTRTGRYSWRSFLPDFSLLSVHLRQQPLQRFYTPTYIRSSVAGAIGTSRRDNYRMLIGSPRDSTALATNTDATDALRRNRRQADPAHALAACLQRGYTAFTGPNRAISTRP